MLTDREVDAFVDDGFIRLRSAIESGVIRDCVESVWDAVEAKGVNRSDPTTWRAPVIRVPCPETQAFAAAGTAPSLWEAYDQLLGEGRWRRREGVGGSIPVRFPSDDDPGDAGWHIEASYMADGSWRTNLRSRGRGLLSLFLLTDVGPDDAPTRVRVGSHMDVPKVLILADDEGFDGGTLSPRVEEASKDRRVEYATGRAGDVYVCHPFIVHAASWPHRGTDPRIIAQPGVALLEPFALDPTKDLFPVEQTILTAIARD